jgi:hypothetical protein
VETPVRLDVVAVVRANQTGVLVPEMSFSRLDQCIRRLASELEPAGASQRLDHAVRFRPIALSRHRVAY